MAQKDKKKQRSKSQGKGAISGLRSGFRGLVRPGSKAKAKETTLSKVINYLLLATAIGLLIYRILR